MIRYLLVALAVFVGALIAAFYLLPTLTTEEIPIPETPELRALRERYNTQGYMTEEDVRLLNKLRDEHLKQLREGRERRLNQE